MTITSIIDARKLRGESEAVLKKQCELRGITARGKKHDMIKILMGWDDRTRDQEPLTFAATQTKRNVLSVQSSNLPRVLQTAKAETNMSELAASPTSQTSLSKEGSDHGLNYNGLSKPLARKRLKIEHRPGGDHTSKCKCMPQIPTSLRGLIDLNKKLPKGKLEELLKSFFACESAGHLLCYWHVQRLASKRLDMQTRTLDRKGLVFRLQHIYDHFADLEKLKTTQTTSIWWRMAGRPHVNTDDLGPYRFFHAEPSAYTFNHKAILDDMDQRFLVRWHQEGTLNIANVFNWWWVQPSKEGLLSIGQIVETEFDMYRHHQREINGKSNLGWQRNMLYSIGQQLMRQDPLYYILYTCLRPDHHWRLISYPYYAKYAVPGDSTQFRHIDMDLSQSVTSGRGAYMIQGSLSIDDEELDDCTELVPGMHKHSREWYNRQVGRGKVMNKYVNRAMKDVLTEEDLEHFETKWVPVPAKRGTVRITMPQLPHGAKGPCKRIRRTMLPWYVGIQDDHNMLEVTEGGTWAQLCQAHREKIAPPASPSGYANHYGDIPYAFPASIDVGGLGSLPDALVGRVPWTDRGVIRARDILLGPDRSAASDYVKRFREIALVAANQAFENLREGERLAFGAKSFFYRRENGLVDPVAEDEATLGDVTGLCHQREISAWLVPQKLGMIADCTLS